ncbi:LysR family transcriptional regulator [Shewanella yunxiaonensis]|uniref:LysR family transcriptional regulator n=1 Tax=Shewanella yunxiaonensis TaxID=2829809 RepID=A0ABX7YSK9_9GAMM|nr:MULTISPECIES: LysR family transcriptional regulator [Shewanella]MDF0533387.1 LysR family transcriptional regulator [Shewanella sp. A32]QUN05769.1 LysR family transcriptional regulator [Shewanella yunxiaonensis]
MKHIDFEKLDMLSLMIIVGLCENKSATHVSKILNIPQSKISRCLRNVRTIFGNELFFRKKYGLIPNEYAKRIYPIAKEIVENAHGFNNLADDHKNSERWFEVAVPGLVTYLYPKALMQSIRNEDKQFHLNIVPWNSSTLQGIQDGEITMGVCCGNHQDAIKLLEGEYEIESVKQLEEVFLICSSKHPLLQQEISLETIAKYPFVKTDLGCNPHSTCPFEDWCHRNELPLDIEISISSVSSLFNYLEESQAVCLVPYKAIYDMLTDIPSLHGCKLAESETMRMASVALPKTVEMVTPLDSDDSDLVWLKDKVREVTLALV